MTRFVSGYIEGYYGRLFSFEERTGIVRKLREIKATHYLYAPKEDPWHRQEWRKPYPADWRKQFKDFVSQSRKAGVHVVPGLAPGLSYRYRSDEDFEALVRKLSSLVELGCEEAALLMDDISEELPKADKGHFRSLGEAHGLMLKKLWPRLSRLGIRRLWFCPTVYSDFFAPKGVAKNRYLKDLSRHLTPFIHVMWTGPAIVSKRLAPADLREVNRVLGRQTVLWDNFYANDYCPGKIFLGPFAQRPASLRQASAGILLNPTGLYQTDLFLLNLLGGFLRGKSSDGVWKKTLRDWQVPSSFLEIARFLASPFELSVPASGAVKKLRKALKPLIWEWKSPLQREWYPYLYALDADLRLLSPADEKPDAAWIRKKYSPILSKMLLASVSPNMR